MTQTWPSPARQIARLILRSWGRTRVAPGYLYQAVERWGKHLSARPLSGRLFNGCEMVCDLHEHIQRQIYFFRAYEPIESFLFHRLIEPGMCVIDAGANVGQYTLIAARAVGPTGQVHAFEPVPLNFESLDLHLRLNRLDRVVHSNACALWDAPGNLTLSLADDDVAENATNYSVNTPRHAAAVVECRAVRLDDYARGQNIRRVDLIKMDIEGAELYALRGALEILESSRPTILIEINRAHSESLGYDPESIWELLRPLGYSVRMIGHTPETSTPLDSLRGVDRANVLFSARPIPESFWQGWSFKQILADFRSNALIVPGRV